MKKKVSDFIADYLVENGINHVFTVVGGGAMHLNDSFGHHPKMYSIYNHHEQASAIAAEGYARVHNKVGLVCVTSGPGAINALNGVAGAYMDSIPMLVISGQTKSSLTVESSGLNLRTLGNQEFNIISALGKMTKYAEMIMEAKKIKYCLEKAIYLANTGRPGPCWLDIPLDIQGAFVELDDLVGYFQTEEVLNVDSEVLIREKVALIVDKLKNAKRPVLYAGNGIRISGGKKIFEKLYKQIGIPVVTCWDSIDLIETESEYYVGRAGIMGDRAGNFAVQNSDLLISIGSRLNIYQVGYNVNTWAREAFVVVNDVDSEELKKPTIRVDLPVCCDAKIFMKALCQQSEDYACTVSTDWIEQCLLWKEKYPVVLPKHYKEKEGINVYAFMDILSKKLGEDSITVVANGSASVVGSQTYYIKKNQRFIMNCGLSSMGYDLPAAIGACVGNDDKEVICIAGDGSVQMNLQELQTIVTNKLPIKIFIINNGGYHQIRLTQNNIFGNGLIGVGPESKDLDFPDFKKLAYAYGIPFVRIEESNMLKEKIEEVLRSNGYCLCEVMCTTTQIFEPKSATKKLKDGSLFSPPLEDLAPFLSREELEENMYIDLIED